MKKKKTEKTQSPFHTAPEHLTYFKEKIEKEKKKKKKSHWPIAITCLLVSIAKWV